MLFALVYISYGYTGWNAASYLAGEIGDAPRRLPRAILLGTSIVTVLYLALNLVYALALPAAEIRAMAAGGHAEAVDPIAQLAASRLFGSRWADRLSVGVGLILLSTLSAYLLTGPRVTFAMARAGQFPAIAGRLSPRTGTPVVATGLQAGWGGGPALERDLRPDRPLRRRRALDGLDARGRPPSTSSGSGGPTSPGRSSSPAIPGSRPSTSSPTLALTVAVFAEEPRIAACSVLSILTGLPVYAVMATAVAEELGRVAT